MKNKALAIISFLSVLGFLVGVWDLPQPLQTHLSSVVWALVGTCAFFGLTEIQPMIDKEATTHLTRAAHSLRNVANHFNLKFDRASDREQGEAHLLNADMFAQDATRIENFIRDQS